MKWVDIKMTNILLLQLINKFIRTSLKYMVSICYVTGISFQIWRWYWAVLKNTSILADLVMSPSSATSHVTLYLLLFPFSFGFLSYKIWIIIVWPDIILGRQVRIARNNVFRVFTQHLACKKGLIHYRTEHHSTGKATAQKIDHLQRGHFGSAWWTTCLGWKCYSLI